jgi:hypothetical protein
VSFYKQQELALTEQERLLAAVIGVNHRIPCGFQIGMTAHLDCAIAEVKELFTRRELPLREEILGELAVWRNHVEEGLKFAQRCDQLMQVVIRTVDEAVRRP